MSHKTEMPPGGSKLRRRKHPSIYARRKLTGLLIATLIRKERHDWTKACVDAKPPVALCSRHSLTSWCTSAQKEFSKERQRMQTLHHQE